MPSTTHVLEEAADLIKGRLAELDDERKRLEKALVELGGKAARRVGRPPGRPPGSRSRKASPKRRRRKGGRADQAASLIEKNPGIGTADLAKAMKIKTSNLYRVLGDLNKAGRVRKEGRKYFPAG